LSALLLDQENDYVVTAKAYPKLARSILIQQSGGWERSTECALLEISIWLLFATAFYANIRRVLTCRIFIIRYLHGLPTFIPEHR
jgi:hypothetical protein